MRESLMSGIEIGLVSISSVLSQDAFVAGTNALTEAGFRVKVAPNVAAGVMEPAAERARLVEAMWLDPEIDLLLFSRGGEGAADVVPLLDWDKLRTRPDLPVIGFSDVTILLNTMLAKGVGHPISGPMLSYARRLTPEAREWLHHVLSGDPLPPVPLRVLHGASSVVRGLPMGGHVTRLHWLWSHGTIPSAIGRIVFLECTARHKAETVIADLDGMRKDGFFDGAAAVVLCDFRHEGADRIALDTFFSSFAAALPCPVFADFPYGHIPGFLALDFRRETTILPDGTLSFAPGNGPILRAF